MFVSSYAKEVKVMICDGTFDESALIYPMEEWYMSKLNGATTLKKMYKDGWRVVALNNLTIKQWVITMEKD